MKKTFELPKEFAEKWINALESENYKQTNYGTLATVDYAIDEDGAEDYGKPKMETCAYCCLGVAAVISGCEFDQITGFDLLNDHEDFFEEKKIPEILLSPEENNLVGVLTSLNDGCTLSRLKEFKSVFPNLKFPKEEFKKTRIYYNFKEIAEFIKLNVEFV